MLLVCHAAEYYFHLPVMMAFASIFGAACTVPGKESWPELVGQAGDAAKIIVEGEVTLHKFSLRISHTIGVFHRWLAAGVSSTKDDECLRSPVRFC